MKKSGKFSNGAVSSGPSLSGDGGPLSQTPLCPIASSSSSCGKFLIGAVALGSSISGEGGALYPTAPCTNVVSSSTPPRFPPRPVSPLSPRPRCSFGSSWLEPCPGGPETNVSGGVRNLGAVSPFLSPLPEEALGLVWEASWSRSLGGSDLGVGLGLGGGPGLDPPLCGVVNCGGDSRPPFAFSGQVGLGGSLGLGFGLRGPGAVGLGSGPCLGPSLFGPSGQGGGSGLVTVPPGSVRFGPFALCSSPELPHLPSFSFVGFEFRIWAVGSLLASLSPMLYSSALSFGAAAGFDDSLGGSGSSSRLGLFEQGQAADVTGGPRFGGALDLSGPCGSVGASCLSFGGITAAGPVAPLVVTSSAVSPRKSSRLANRDLVRPLDRAVARKALLREGALLPSPDPGATALRRTQYKSRLCGVVLEDAAASKFMEFQGLSS